MQKLGAAPNIAIGSVHAVTETGHVYITSNTGSQLPSYVYGSDKIIWVVGTQKIVKSDADAAKRIYEYVLPLESDRAHKAWRARKQCEQATHSKQGSKTQPDYDDYRKRSAWLLTFKKLL